MVCLSKRSKQMIRKSTPKYEVVHTASGTVCLSGVSKTEATKTARSMAKGRPGSVIARRVVA